jgi:hypothetical protein
MNQELEKLRHHYFYTCEHLITYDELRLFY